MNPDIVVRDETGADAGAIAEATAAAFKALAISQIPAVARRIAAAKSPRPPRKGAKKTEMNIFLAFHLAPCRAARDPHPVDSVHPRGG